MKKWNYINGIVFGKEYKCKFGRAKKKMIKYGLFDCNGFPYVKDYEEANKLIRLRVVSGSINMGKRIFLDDAFVTGHKETKWYVLLWTWKNYYPYLWIGKILIIFRLETGKDGNKINSAFIEYFQLCPTVDEIYPMNWAVYVFVGEKVTKMKHAAQEGGKYEKLIVSEEFLLLRHTKIGWVWKFCTGKHAH